MVATCSCMVTACVASQRACTSYDDLLELLSLLIPRIPTKLLAQEFARNKVSCAPHVALEALRAYQFSLISLLSWAFQRPGIDRNPRVIPEASELSGRVRVRLVAINHGVCAIEIGAFMDASAMTSVTSAASALAAATYAMLEDGHRTAARPSKDSRCR